jgi:hypothetical protein
MAIFIEIEKGISIYSAAKQATERAKKINSNVEFVFNDITLNVSPHSFDEDIVLIYALKQRIARLEHKNLKVF